MYLSPSAETVASDATYWGPGRGAYPPSEISAEASDRRQKQKQNVNFLWEMRL